MSYDMKQGSGNCCNTSPAQNITGPAVNEPAEILTPTLNQQPITVGDRVLVYSTEWHGPRPGTVVCVHGTSYSNVNVDFDWTQDFALIQRRFVQSNPPQGSTISSCPIFQTMTKGQTKNQYDNAYRAKGQHGIPSYWAELPTPAPQVFVPVKLKN